jgi:cyclic beta-1,2-glucan synthetase
MYRLGLEAILGITRLGATLKIDPCIPRHWPGFKVDYRYGSAHYKIRVENPSHINRSALPGQIQLDGKQVPGNLIPLVDDGQTHEVLVTMG